MELKENTSSVDSQFFGIVNTNAHKEQISTIVDSSQMTRVARLRSGFFISNNTLYPASSIYVGILSNMQRY